MNEQEIPKYKKKKESSVSKSKMKAKHKHDYSCECLLKQRILYYSGKTEWCYAKVTYCSICGKIQNYHFGEAIETENGLYRMLTKEEFLEKYKNLEVVETNEFFKLKYIPIGSEINNDDV